MKPLKEGYYGYKLFKASAIAAIAFSALLADCLTGFKRLNQFGRWAAIVLGNLGVVAAVYYWRRLHGGRSRHHHTRECHHPNEPEATHRPAELPPRRQ